MSSQVSAPADVVVVGAGVNGLMVARELAQAGRQVLLLERGRVGGEASWAGGGIVSPLYPWRYAEPVTALASTAQRAYPLLSQALVAETGIDPELAPCGLLMLDADDARDAVQWAQGHGHEIHCLGSAALQQQLPGLGSGWRQGLWMPAIANVRNPRLLKALLASVRQLGVTVVEQAEVVAWTAEAGRLQRLHLADGRQAGAEQVVVCGGAWSRVFLEKAGVATPPVLRPVRGQMLLYKRPAGELPCIVLAQGRYVIPRRDGHILCGSTLEESGFDKSTTPEALRSLQASAQKLWPALAGEEPVLQWAGLRPAAPNGIPYIGKVPGYDNLWINAGQFRNGLVLAPASAGLLADLMLGREPRVDPRPYRLLP
ncbi:MAG TPA: glycine oxidase ThiO [Moraxellaceae bacterium]